jgi:hypothetical protein
VISDGNLAHSGDSIGNTGSYRCTWRHGPARSRRRRATRGESWSTARRSPGRSTWAIWTCGASRRARGTAIVVRAGEVSDAGTSSRGCACQAVRSSAGNERGGPRGRGRRHGRRERDVPRRRRRREPAHSGDSIGNTGAYRLHLAKAPGARHDLGERRGREPRQRRHAARRPSTWATWTVELHGERGRRDRRARGGGHGQRATSSRGSACTARRGRCSGRAAGTSRRRSRSTAPRAGRTCRRQRRQPSHSGDSLGNTGTLPAAPRWSRRALRRRRRGRVRVPQGAYDGTIHSRRPRSVELLRGQRQRARRSTPIRSPTTGTSSRGCACTGPTGRSSEPTPGTPREHRRDAPRRAALHGRRRGRQPRALRRLSGQHGSYHLTISGNAGCSPSCIAPLGLVSWWRAEGERPRRERGQRRDAPERRDVLLRARRPGLRSGRRRRRRLFPDHGTLEQTTSFTWDAWIRPDSIANTAVVMAKRLDVEPHRDSRSWPARAVRLLRRQAQRGRLGCSTTSAVPAGQFTHSRWSKGGGADELRLYANGELVARRTGVGNPAGNAAPSALGKSRPTVATSRHRR